MENTIKNILLPAFGKAQHFLLKLLSEYYEQKAEKDILEKAELCEQNLMLKIVNQKLIMQVSNLKVENKNLTEKYKTANNMIRILSEQKEDNDGYKTPREVNILKIENLLKQKLKDKHNNYKKFLFDFDKETMKIYSPQMKKRAESKVINNNKLKLSSLTTNAKPMRNVLKPIQNQVNEKRTLFMTPMKDAAKPLYNNKNLLSIGQRRKVNSPSPDIRKKNAFNVRKPVAKKVSEKVENKENIRVPPKMKSPSDTPKFPESKQSKIPVRSQSNVQTKFKTLQPKMINSTINLAKDWRNRTFIVNKKGCQ